MTFRITIRTPEGRIRAIAPFASTRAAISAVQLQFGLNALSVSVVPVRS